MKISVIIPTLNEEEAIEKTLRQIHDNLTAFAHELIVTDSGSTDRTVAIAKRYARVVVDASPSHTIASNRNNGARIAHGEFLVFIDADVIIPDPNAFFKTALQDFAADKNLMAITARLMVFPESATRMDNIVFGLVSVDHWLNNNVIRMGSASGEFQMIRRSAFDAVHGFQPQLAVAEDNDMFRRLAKIGRTKMEWRLTVYHTGRRPHEIGWPRVLWDWGINYLYVRLLNRSYNKVWRPVRLMKLSFVIPAYNEAHYLPDCLNAILKQKEKLPYDIEIIVVNNASTDRTRKIAESYASRGIVVVNEPEKGLVRARRAGFRAATGDLIANVDADTRLTDGWIKKVMEAFAKDEKLVAFSGPFIYYDVPRKVRAFTKLFYYLGYFFYLINRFILRAGSMLQGGNFVVRRSALEKAGGYNTDIDFYGEDTDVARRLSKVGKVRFAFGLPMYSSGRRLAKEGGLTMALRYGLNYFWMIFFKRPFSKVSVDVRLTNKNTAFYRPENRKKELLIAATTIVIFLAILCSVLYLVYRFAR